MPHQLTLRDRIRIESRVWALDQQLYDLPRRSRIAKRREVRANLIEASADHGAREALRRIGSSTELAREYLGAELGDGPRHSWMAAGFFAAFMPLILNYVLSETANAYEQALADGHAASGAFVWTGASYLQSPLTFTIHDGQVTHTGGAWTPLVYGLWLAGTVACGRLWRLLKSGSASRHHRADVSDATGTH
jgi:hypothetical protein